MTKREVNIQHILVCLFVIGISGSESLLHPGICKEYIKGECGCYKTVNIPTHDLHTAERKVPFFCDRRCDQYPCCNEGRGKYCEESLPKCPGITIVTREQWNASAATHPVGIITKSVPEFYIHHTDGKQCFDIPTCAIVLQSIQQYHFSLGWFDIGYSFLVGQDGRIYEGRGWNKVGSHTEGYNSISYAASFVGNYMKQLPNDKSMQAVKQLISCGVTEGKIDSLYTLYGHRDACGDTDCPGDELYKEIHSWTYFNRTVNPSSGCVSHSRRCKCGKDTCKKGSLIEGTSLCKGPCKYCCLKL